MHFVCWNVVRSTRRRKLNSDEKELHMKPGTKPKIKTQHTKTKNTMTDTNVNYIISAQRADELDEATRAWCLSLVLANRTICRTGANSTRRAVAAEVRAELASASNAVLLAAPAVQPDGRLRLCTRVRGPPLPIRHDAEDPPQAKRARPAPRAVASSSSTSSGTSDAEAEEKAPPPLGFLLYDLEDTDMEPEDGFCAYVVEVHVAAAARGRGVGRALLAALEQVAGDAGASCVRLTCANKNARAHAFYAAHGFVRDADSPDPALHMPYTILRKQLPKQDGKEG